MPVRVRTTLTTPGTPADILPLRLTATAEPTFQGLVRRVSERVGDLLRHQRFRGEELHREPPCAQGLPGVLVEVVSFDGARVDVVSAARAGAPIRGRLGAVRPII
ncbi:hypothetical protein [Streptomyces sp. NPDC091217]|uniref:hypothetical protein n=1 Tax=Streptomyces sp. NPDC091217 TaxID=3365975 RepID=UPI0038153F39